MAIGLMGGIALQTCPDCLGTLTPDDCEVQNEELNLSGLIGFNFLCLACILRCKGQLHWYLEF